MLSITSNWIKVRVDSYNSKLRFTIPAREVRVINAKTDDYIRVDLKKGGYSTYYYARIPSMSESRTNLQVRRAVPKEFVEKAKVRGNDIIELRISLVRNRRSNKLIQNDTLDVLAVVPTKTKYGKSIMVDTFYRNDEEYCRIWYCSGQGGNFRPIELKRWIKLDREVGEFFGLMQAESRKVGHKFDFTNNLISEHKLFIKIAERFNISKDSWKYSLYYNPELPEDYVEKCALEFKKEFKVNKHIGYIKSKTLSDVSYAVYINSNILAEVMISILLALRLKIAKLAKQKAIPKNIEDFAIGFICKDLLGDGTVVYNKANQDFGIEISEENKDSQNDIVSMFNYFGIRTKIFRNKIRLPHNLKTVLWLLGNKAFQGHKNRRRLIGNIIKKSYFRYFYSRFRDRDKFTKEQFSSKHNLTSGTSAMYLYRNSKKGFLIKKGDCYELSNIGKKMIEVFKNAENELTSLCKHQ